MSYYKRTLAGLLVLVIMLSAILIPVKATEPETEETPEKRAEREATEMPIETNALKGWPQGPQTHGEAAIVMEAGTGAVLYAKNIDAKEYPASITKLLTVLVALKNGKLEDKVSISEDCVSFLEPGDASVGLKQGNEINLEQALYATLLASANEAAYAVAENVGKNAGHDYNWFIAEMNQTCKELGGEHSNFANPNGLHLDNHYTCARDMALISKELFQFPEFLKIEQTYEYKIPASATTEEHVFQQNHKMLVEGYKDYYELAIAGKTGYTDQALSTLVTFADNGETKLVCVLLRNHGANAYPDTRGLLDYAFANFKKTKIAGNENSKDIESIIEEAGTSDYVMLPEGISFDKLDKEMAVEKGQSKEAALTYSYQGFPVGGARAELSQSYMEEHSVKIKEKKKTEEKNKDKGIIKKVKAVSATAIAVVIILIAAYSRYVYVTRKTHRRKQRKRRRR